MTGWHDLGSGWWMVQRNDEWLHAKVEDGYIVEARCFELGGGHWKADLRRRVK